MDRSDEIVRSLTEIRDLQREVFAEHKRMHEENVALYRTNMSETHAQNRRAINNSHAAMWTFMFLLAISITVNFIVLASVVGSK
jgi:hypothetical protein